MLDAALAEPAPDSAESDALRAALGEPFTLLEDLPMLGVSLALRSLSVSTRDDVERVQNPTVECSARDGEPGEPLSVEAGGRLPMLCAVSGTYDGDAALWGYTTAGGWEGEAQELDPGDIDKEYVWIAPKEAPDVPVPIWVVSVDGFGGVGLWSGEGEVTLAPQIGRPERLRSHLQASQNHPCSSRNLSSSTNPLLCEGSMSRGRYL